MQKLFLVLLFIFATSAIGQNRPLGNVGGKGGNGSRHDLDVFKKGYEYEEVHCSERNRPYGRRLEYVCGRLEDLIVRERATDDQLFYYDDCCLKPE